MLEDNISQKYVSLIINDNEFKESILYRIKQKTILHIYPGPTLLGKSIAIFCNYPKKGATFERQLYNILQWHCNKSDEPITSAGTFNRIANTEMYCEIIPELPGSYHYYITYENDPNKKQGSGYFCKDPEIQIGLHPNRNAITPDAVRCQTVLVKCLGPLTLWESKLKVTKESGYNMIHLTPIQELGDSRSSYCISDQLKLNNSIGSNFQEFRQFLLSISNNWKIAFVCDIVLNHTANESIWLKEHPECAYNCKNSPHLRPAALFDYMLHKISDDVSTNVLKSVGIPSNITDEETLQKLKSIIMENYIPKLKLWQFYQLDIKALTEEFENLAAENTVRKNKINDHIFDLAILQNPEYNRLSSRVDLFKALDKFLIRSDDCVNDEVLKEKCVNKFKLYISELNNNIFEEIQSHLRAAVDNIIAGIRYERIEECGPKYKLINKRHPLFPRYFTDFCEKESTLKEAEEIIFSDKGLFVMAHNGWVMNADPLKDFAKCQDGIGNVYLRRELIAWGDCVKLRYGNCIEDSQFLWEHMRKYVEQSARLFHGVRLDNCHSTPLHVAEFLLDCARKINPNLYVMAELFTNSHEKDNIFVNRLGITTLIREAQAAWDSHEEGRLVYRYGGESVGSFEKYKDNRNNEVLTPVIANALFMDLTHDNPSPIEKRSVYDLIPTSALVAMACCGTGSNRGYDELIPHHIHVVDEVREYAAWHNKLLAAGIMSVKKSLNDLHEYLLNYGFSEVYVDQMTEHIVAVTRHNPQTHESIILVAYTTFQHPNNNWPNSYPNIPPLCIEGCLKEIIFEIELEESTNKENIFTKNSNIINGLMNYIANIKVNIDLSESKMLENVRNENSKNIFNFKIFKPGSVLAVRISLEKSSNDSLKKFHDLLKSINNNLNTELKSILTKLDLNHCNQILYKCDKEERDGNHNTGVYVVPKYGPLVYCGLQGFISVLDDIKKNNDLSHPLCCNLREGNWMMDYIWQRLQNQDGLSDLSYWVKDLFDPLKQIPRYLIPKYFEKAVRALYNVITDHSISMMAEFIRKGDTFIRLLALSTLQFVSVCPSAKLPPFSPKLPSVVDNTQCATLSAGLPHFVTDYMRCWGRDTFISLRGLLLLTGRFAEAQQMILGFAACLRHGLIPNLLSDGYNARYNCRDAVWWWLECIKSYITLVPKGSCIFNDMVSRLYPQDDSEPKSPGECDQPLYEVIQESLQKHFEGLNFRERNAGQQIDEHMTNEGFNNEIGVDLETGFVYGGNEFNCGTWMDKMGSSVKARTKGVPATPRDGSAVEIVGLSYSVVTWLAECFKNKIYPYDGVSKVLDNEIIIKWTFEEWSNKIKTNFESNFYINNYEEYVNQLYIYKDTVGATNKWPDYQMRCNFPIAMAIAPDLFKTENAWKALEKVKNILLSPLGMKTLDPSDWAYRPNYDNSNDSSDSSVAQGFNYHQGPEWLWPVGFYFRARLYFARQVGCLEEILSEVRTALSNHLVEIEKNHWRGLPELTNDNGSFCKDSCSTQAWSVATILEVLYDIDEYKKSFT